MSEISCLPLRTCHYSEVLSPILLSFREQQTFLYISNALLKAELKQLTTPENTITYYNALCLSPQNFA